MPLIHEYSSSHRLVAEDPAPSPLVQQNKFSQSCVRVLVDRLWPRGLTKAQAHIDLWLKGIAPSTELRQWFGHNPERWEAFKERYLAELNANLEPIQRLKEQLDKGKVTLVYAAKDEQHNHARVILENSALFF
ncbi:DUF488 domain-containing protein [Methylomonas sp. MgM2]